jgi:GAF domain
VESLESERHICRKNSCPSVQEPRIGDIPHQSIHQLPSGVLRLTSVGEIPCGQGRLGDYNDRLENPSPVKPDLGIFKELISEATDESLARLLELLLEKFSAERGCIWIESRGKVIYRGNSELKMSYPFSRQVVRAAVRTRVGLVSFDVAEDDRFQPTESINATQIRSCLCAPARNAEGGILAVVYFDDKTTRGYFTEDNLNFLIALMAEFPGAAPQV